MGALELTREQAEEVLYGGEIVRDRISGHRRWAVDHEVIFRHDDGQLYGMRYSVGATESQEQDPFDEALVVKCVPVREVMVVDYEEIK